LPALSGCGGLGQSTAGAVPQGASAPLAPAAGIRDSLSASARLPAAPSVAGPKYLLYVANTGNNSITVYNTTASGNTAPIATIAGSNTQLNNPWQLSEDAKGNLYVANRFPGSTILVFAHGANGNVAPVQAISGPLTGLSSGLYTATVDQESEKIFAVVDIPGAPGPSDLLRFPINATGNEAPLATSPGMIGANQLVSDSTGKKLIYASDSGICCSTATFGVYSIDKFPNSAHPSQRPYIHNFGATGLADDPTTGTFLVSGNDGVTQGIFRFQEDTVGEGAYEFGPPPLPSYTPAVVSVITSDTCGSQLALGHDRNLYVVHSTGNFGNPCAADAVYVYQHDASGNAAPLRVLTGSATQLDEPSGIHIGV
jgi:hypothetical protein